MHSLKTSVRPSSAVRPVREHDRGPAFYRNGDILILFTVVISGHVNLHSEKFYSSI